MPRRFHVSRVQLGDVLFDADTAHHARDVLRLEPGAAVELFDDAGEIGVATLAIVSPDRVVAMVESIERAARRAAIRIAAAVPKGPRADWMIEKLGELGVDRFTPLACARSVALPAGTGKLDRWQRLAEEAARQSRRGGVMRVDALTHLADVIAEGAGLFGSTVAPARPMPRFEPGREATICIGPEGGFTEAEEAAFIASGWTPATLGATVLRIETAAIAAAVLALRVGDE